VYLTYNNGNYTAWPSEGGHCEFAPRTQLEIELLQVRTFNQNFLCVI
jgi:glucokinase